MRPDELDRERLNALGPAPLAELLHLHLLMLPDYDRADAIGPYWEPEDAELRRVADRLRGGRVLRAVLIGMLRSVIGASLGLVEPLLGEHR